MEEFLPNRRSRQRRDASSCTLPPSHSFQRSIDWTPAPIQIRAFVLVPHVDDEIMGMRAHDAPTRQARCRYEGGIHERSRSMSKEGMYDPSYKDGPG